MFCRNLIFCYLVTVLTESPEVKCTVFGLRVGQCQSRYLLSGLCETVFGLSIRHHYTCQSCYMYDVNVHCSVYAWVAQCCMLFVVRAVQCQSCIAFDRCQSLVCPCRVQTRPVSLPRRRRWLRGPRLLRVSCADLRQIACGLAAPIGGGPGDNERPC